MHVTLEQHEEIHHLIFRLERGLVTVCDLTRDILVAYFFKGHTMAVFCQSQDFKDFASGFDVTVRKPVPSQTPDNLGVPGMTMTQVFGITPPRTSLYVLLLTQSPSRSRRV